MFWAGSRLLITNVVAGPALAVIMIVRYLTGPGNYIAHLGSYSVVKGGWGTEEARGREKKRE